MDCSTCSLESPPKKSFHHLSRPELQESSIELHKHSALKKLKGAALSNRKIAERFLHFLPGFRNLKNSYQFHSLLCTETLFLNEFSGRKEETDLLESNALLARLH
jgi:hypothetical protein